MGDNWSAPGAHDPGARARANFRTVFRTVLLVLVGLAALGGQRAEATNGARLTSNGARSAGRGGVDYAYADDGIGPANNPAGMVWVYGNRLDQYWALVDPRVTWSNSFGKFDDRDVLFAPVPAFSFGAFFDPFKEWEIAPLFDLGGWGLRDEGDEGEAGIERPEESLDAEALDYGSRVKFGFGVFPITGGKVQLKKMRTAGFPDPLDWEVDTLALAITPSLAFRLNKYFSIGVNLQFIYSKFELDGGIAQPRSTLNDDFEFAATLLNDNPQIITKADLDDAFTYGFSSRIGFMFHTEMFSAGFVYQDRTYSADYLGRANVDAKDEVDALTSTAGGPAALQLINPAIVPSRGFNGNYDLRIQDYDYPRQVGLGIAFRPHRRFSVGIDYTYIGWKEVFRKFRARLTKGDNSNLDIMTARSIRVTVPLEYTDQHVVALGITALVAEGDDIVEGVPSWALVLRAGYNYGETPVPEKTTLPPLPVINEHHVSCGFSFLWGPLVEISAAFEYQLPNEFDVGVHKGDFTLSNSKQEVEIFFVQFGLGVNF